jgi:hypothetical protein
MGTVKELAAFVSRNPAAAAIIAVAALAAAWMLWHAGRRLAAGARAALRGHQAEDLLTVVAAGMATAVAANGMWRFAGQVLHFSGAERATLFAFLEVSVVACAFRARRNMRSFGSAGAEGVAVWVLSGLSAVFSALDAASAAEAVFRLAPPLVAAWLWHRAMSLEHRRSTGRAVHWRLTAERILVWLGLAEPSARAASEVDAHRRIARLARAAKRLRERRASGAAAWRQQRARRRLDKALEGAVEHAGLASDPGRQDQMLQQIGALNAAEALASLAAAAPWDRRGDADASARVRELEQSLESTRVRIAELSAALAHAGSGADPHAGDDGRDALVTELAEAIREAAAAGDRWRPDYEDLMARTGRQKRWCEYVVRDARSAVLGSGPEAAPGSARDSAPQPAHADPGENGRAEQLALVNGSGPVT